MDSWMLRLYFGLYPPSPLLLELFQLWPFGALLVVCVCVCVYTFLLLCVFEYFFIFESYKMLQDHPGHFMPQSYNQQFLPKSPFSFSWRMVLETKIWAVGVLFAKGV